MPQEPPPGDLLRALLPSPQGYHCRDALAKNIYSRLFDWLVNRINTSIQVSTGHCPPLGSPPLPSRGWDVAQHPAAVSQVKPGKQRKVMGVLDIYGFEIFQVSSRTHLGPSCCWGERRAGLGAPARTCHSGPFSRRTTASSSSSSTTAMRSCSRSSS